MTMGHSHLRRMLWTRINKGLLKLLFYEFSLHETHVVGSYDKSQMVKRCRKILIETPKRLTTFM